MSRPRAVVIGSGACGGMLARLLARSGDWDVVVLEKGENFFTGLGGPTEAVGNVWASDELGYEIRGGPCGQDPLLEPRSFRPDPAAGARAFVGAVQTLPTTVGGGTVHFDGKARRMREVDFITNTLLGGGPDRPAIPGTTYTDWPLTYRLLEPFYAVSEEIVGVQGPARRVDARVVNPNPHESWRSTPFPMPPGVPMLSGLLVQEAGRRLGWTVAPVPTAVISRPYRGRPPCVDCAQCKNYGCPINAKSSAAWLLHDALRTGRAELRTRAHVVQIEHRKAGGRYRASGVVYLDERGREQRLAADLVVLANTPIEATRLSLLSGIGRAPDETRLEQVGGTSTEPSGLLGRNLMFHLQTLAFAIMNQEIHSERGRTSTHTLDAFAGAGPDPGRFDATVPRGGIVEIGGARFPISEAISAHLLIGAAHREWMRLGPLTRRIVGLAMQGEDMPQVSNYVDLDPRIVDVLDQPVPRITYRPHPYERAAAAHYGPKLHDLLQAIGGAGSRWPELRPLFAAVLNPSLPPQGEAPTALRSDQIPASAHIMGTHRMALDPEHGPCDPFGRYWAFDNLYHVGGGLFCTAPGFNVTLTLWALSYRAAASILTGVGRRSSYSMSAVEDAQSRLLQVMRTLDADTMAARSRASP